MDYYELYQTDPSAVIVAVVISFIITMFLYGAFPVIFAKKTKKL